MQSIKWDRFWNIAGALSPIVLFAILGRIGDLFGWWGFIGFVSLAVLLLIVFWRDSRTEIRNVGGPMGPTQYEEFKYW